MIAVWCLVGCFAFGVLIIPVAVALQHWQRAECLAGQIGFLQRLLAETESRQARLERLLEEKEGQIDRLRDYVVRIPAELQWLRSAPAAAGAPSCRAGSTSGYPRAWRSASGTAGASGPAPPRRGRLPPDQYAPIHPPCSNARIGHTQSGCQWRSEVVLRKCGAGSCQQVTSGAGSAPV